MWFQYDAARSKGLVFLDIAHGFHEPWTVEHDDPGAAPISVRQSEVHEDD